MARGWPFGLVALVACFPRQASSFFGHPSLPRAVSRPAARTSTATTTTAVAAAPTPGDGAPVNARTAPPSYIARNNVSLAGDFVSSREGEPTADELADENLMRMLAQKGSDEEVNWIVWKCLGYRYDSDEDAWKAVKVFPRWQEKYPEPVDFVGVTRIYQPEVDKPVFRALQDVTKAIPFEYKRLIVEKLKPLGFTGFLLDELTPNRTRRAQLTNFLIYYREHLWGVPVEEVERRRVARKAARAREPMSDMLEG